MVIVAQWMFEWSQTKPRRCQASKQSCCVAFVPVTGRGSRSAQPPQGREPKLLVAVVVREENKIPSFLETHMLGTSPSWHSFFVRPIKTSRQYTQQNKNKSQSTEKKHTVNQKRDLLEQNQRGKHQHGPRCFPASSTNTACKSKS